MSVTRPDDLKDLTHAFCMIMSLLSVGRLLIHRLTLPVPLYLVASHAVAVEDPDLFVLLAGHVVQALVGLHVTDLGRNDTTAAIIQNTFTHSGGVWIQTITHMLVHPLVGASLCSDFIKAVKSGQSVECVCVDTSPRE